jgi:hypothetical protein
MCNCVVVVTLVVVDNVKCGASVPSEVKDGKGGVNGKHLGTHLVVTEVCG